MRSFAAVIERDPDTGCFVGLVPGFPRAHSQATTLAELNANLHEFVAMLLEDGEPAPPLEMPACLSRRRSVRHTMPGRTPLCGPGFREESQ